MIPHAFASLSLADFIGGSGPPATADLPSWGELRSRYLSRYRLGRPRPGSHVRESRNPPFPAGFRERTTGFEPATLSLGS